MIHRIAGDYPYLFSCFGARILLMDGNQEIAIEEIEAVMNASGFSLCLVIVTMVLGLLAIRLFLTVVKRLLLISSLDNALIRFVTTSIRVLLVVTLVLYSMSLLEIPLTSMIAVLSAAGVAIGLAIQDSIANVANGLIMIGTRPFKVGDYVRIGDDEGTIEELRLMNTVLSTVDNKKLILPNKTVFTSRIENFNTNPIRRIDLVFTVDYDTDLSMALDVTRKACMSVPAVLAKPAPRVEFYEAAASSLNISAWCWCATSEYWNAYFGIQRAVYDAYMEHKIQIPYDQLMVSMRNAKRPAAKRVAKATAGQEERK